MFSIPACIGLFAVYGVLEDAGRGSGRSRHPRSQDDVKCPEASASQRIRAEVSSCIAEDRRGLHRGPCNPPRNELASLQSAMKTE
jgi:hypothetical protein